MPEADVLYSDVKFVKSGEKANGRVSSAGDTTYSEVKISKASQPLTELTDPPQAGSDRRSGVTSERLAVVVLTVLLLAAAAALGFITYESLQTNQRLSAENERLRQNLTEQRNCPTRPRVTVTPTCWTREICWKCGEGWKQFGAKCYHFSIDESSWSESRAACGAGGGHLVKIESREEQIFLDEELRPKMREDEDKFWIGLSDSATENTWLWADGSPLNQSLTFWSEGEPDNWEDNSAIEEDCGRMGERGGAVNHSSWFDHSCEKPHRYICEKQAERGRPECL